MGDIVCEAKCQIPLYLRALVCRGAWSEGVFSSLLCSSEEVGDVVCNIGNASGLRENMELSTEHICN